MRIGRIEGLTGHRVDGRWQRSIEVVLENRSTTSVADVVVRAAAAGWETHARLGDLDGEAVLPALLVVPNDVSIVDMVITLGFTDERGKRCFVEERWPPGPDPVRSVSSRQSGRVSVVTPESGPPIS